MRLCWLENREYMQPEKGQVLVSAEYRYNFISLPRLRLVEGERKIEQHIDAHEDAKVVCANFIARMNAMHEESPTTTPVYGGMLEDFQSLFSPALEAATNG